MKKKRMKLFKININDKNLTNFFENSSLRFIEDFRFGFEIILRYIKNYKSRD